MHAVIPTHTIKMELRLLYCREPTIVHVFVYITCSGGNKRKLSTALALIGDPPIILLVSVHVHMYNNTWIKVFFIELVLGYRYHPLHMQ